MEHSNAGLPTSSSFRDEEINVEERKSSRNHRSERPEFKSEPLWRCTDPLQYPPPKADGDPWERCRQIVDDHDRGMCGAWKDEIQSLLIFAGLFSGVVTGFAIQSLQLLQQDPSDHSAQLLSRISAQLERLSMNSTLSTPDLPAPLPFVVSRSAVRVNILWSVSLTLSLATVLVGILCLQWLREYQRSDSTLRPQEAIGVRQVTYTALIQWRVPLIVSSLPLLLQSGLVLFLVGLVDLIWTTNHIVAIPLAVFVGLTLLVLLVTTISPVICDLVHLLRFRKDYEPGLPPCPYKSPQSWAFLQIIYATAKASFAVFHGLGVQKSFFFQISSGLFNVPNWTAYDRWWKGWCSEDEADGLAWIANTFNHSTIAAHTIYRCVSEQSDVEMIWRTSQLIKHYGKTFKVPLKLDLSAPFYRSFVRDLALFDMLSFLLPSRTPLDHWLLIHKLELFIRLKSSWISNDDYLNNFLPGINVSCPSLFNHVEVRREHLPEIPDRLRIQLFNCFCLGIENNEGPWDDAYSYAGNLLGLLSTIILSPLNDEGIVPYLDHGSLVLKRWATQGQGSGNGTLVSESSNLVAQSFHFQCLRPLMTRFNEERFLLQLPQLVGSEIFLEFLDTIYDTIELQYRAYTLWDRFLSLSHLEERYRKKEQIDLVRDNSIMKIDS